MIGVCILVTIAASTVLMVAVGYACRGDGP
jgi:hypothetical protein